MIRPAIAPLLAGLLAVAGSACVPPAPRTAPERVPAGQAFLGSYINITAPKSEAWHLLESSGRGMAFARQGESPNASFAASVMMFDLPPTNGAKEFEELIVRQASGDLETKRFTTKEFSHHYNDARGYPCVRMHNLSEDREARTASGGTAALMIENENLYCRHPVRTDTGFVITFSHRGSGRHAQLRRDADAFLDGVQVPNHPPTP